MKLHSLVQSVTRIECCVQLQLNDIICVRPDWGNRFYWAVVTDNSGLDICARILDRGYSRDRGVYISNTHLYNGLWTVERPVKGSVLFLEQT